MMLKYVVCISLWHNKLILWYIEFLILMLLEIVILKLKLLIFLLSSYEINMFSIQNTECIKLKYINRVRLKTTQ